MKKKYKLLLSGIILFSLTFLFLVYYLNIPLFGKTIECGDLCQWISNVKVSEEKVVIQNNVFQVQKISIKKETGVAIFLENKDQKQHYVIEQCAVDGRYDLDSLGWEFSVKPGETVSAIGFYNPPKELEQKSMYLKVLPSGAKLSTPHGEECILFCKSCSTGLRSVKIILEK